MYKVLKKVNETKDKTRNSNWVHDEKHPKYLVLQEVVEIKMHGWGCATRDDVCVIAS